MFDGHCEHAFSDGRQAGVRDHMVGAKWDGYAASYEHYKHPVHRGLDARVGVLGGIGGTPATGAIGQPVSDGHYEHTAQDGRSTRVRMT